MASEPSNKEHVIRIRKALRALTRGIQILQPDRPEPANCPSCARKAEQIRHMAAKRIEDKRTIKGLMHQNANLIASLARLQKVEREERDFGAMRRGMGLLQEALTQVRAQRDALQEESERRQKQCPTITTG